MYFENHARAKWHGYRRLKCILKNYFSRGANKLTFKDFVMCRIFSSMPTRRKCSQRAFIFVVLIFSSQIIHTIHATTIAHSMENQLLVVSLTSYAVFQFLLNRSRKQSYNSSQCFVLFRIWKEIGKFVKILNSNNQVIISNHCLFVN